MKTQPTVRLAKPLKTIGVAVALAFAATASMAGTSTAYVYSVTTDAGPLLLAWDDSTFQTLDTRTLSAGGLFGSKIGHAEGTTFTNQFNTSSSPYASAIAQNGGTGPGLSVTATTSKIPSPGPYGTVPTQANADGNQSGGFYLYDPILVALGQGDGLTAGSVTFTVDYQLSVNTPEVSFIDNYSQAFVNLLLQNGDGSQSKSFSDALSSTSFVSGVGGKLGEFTFTLNLASGEIGYMNLGANAVSFSTAAIPEPSEWALMSAGLLAVAAIARRRKATTVA